MVPCNATDNSVNQIEVAVKVLNAGFFNHAKYSFWREFRMIRYCRCIVEFTNSNYRISVPLNILTLLNISVATSNEIALLWNTSMEVV